MSTNRNEPDASHHLVGQIVDGRFQVIEKVGAGQMAIVYVAEQLSMRRRVALKVLHRSLCAEGDAIMRFQREVEAVARLQSPHTIEFYDHGSTASGALYIAMELLSKDTLRTRLDAQPILPMHEVRTIVDQIAAALGEAHAEGVIHRDLKPENVHFGTSASPLRPFVKVLDFGLSKIQDPATGSGRETAEHITVGTPAYLAPEAAMTGKVTDWRADIYALGVMTFEMLLGRRPFVANNPVAMMIAHTREPIPSARALRHELPEGIDLFFQRALAKDPHQRFASAKELSDALAQVVG